MTEMPEPQVHQPRIDHETIIAEAVARLAALSPYEYEAIRKDDSTIFNFGASYDFGDWELGFDVLNLTDADDDDIAYWFESRLATEPAGVEDIHFHPSNPRTYRATLRYKF